MARHASFASFETFLRTLPPSCMSDACSSPMACGQLRKRQNLQVVFSGASNICKDNLERCNWWNQGSAELTDLNDLSDSVLHTQSSIITTWCCSLKQLKSLSILIDI